MTGASYNAPKVGAAYRRLNQLAKQIATRQGKGLPIDQKAKDEVAALKAEIARLKGKGTQQ